MKQRYDLISFDMDGTLLNREHRISGPTKEALDLAVSHGKTVVLSTGRSVAELAEYDKELELIRYYICENGALLFDSFEKQIIYSMTIPQEMVSEVLKITEPEDVMIYIASNGQNMSNRNDVMRMEHFHMGQYKEQALRTAILHKDIIASYRKEPFPVEKMNLSCVSVELRETLYSNLRKLPLTIAYSEETALELSPLNVSKALGLQKLCDHLSIPLERTIAVGDSNNDAEIMKTAGLAIAMGNSLPKIKEMCDAIVADNNHNGCAEAIIKYLLKDL